MAVETQGDTPAEKEADDERFMRELRALYSAPDADSARAVLSAVTLSGELRIDSVTKYVLEFTKAVAAHQVAATALGEGSVKDIFLMMAFLISAPRSAKASYGFSDLSAAQWKFL